MVAEQVLQAAFLDELDKIASDSSFKGAASGKLKLFMEGAKGEFGPALGATLGAGVAKMHGIDPLAGAAAGYGVGALPEVIHGIRHRRAAV